MNVLNSLLALKVQSPSKLPSTFRQPGNCPMLMCSALEKYEQELERHRVTEAKLREAIIREGNLVREKEELLVLKGILAKESEHRLLNGLQLITSVLSMQSRDAKNTELAAQLTMAANRVAAIARVHQHLHTLDKLDSVAFKQFLEKLSQDLCSLTGNGSKARSLCVDGDELMIPQAKAIPLAYIASELITNSIKYAKGKIVVSLQTIPNGDGVLSVSDDGAGLPESFDPSATSGLGMKIIAALVSQIHGELKFGKEKHGPGTRFSVQFNPLETL